ncbi:MAG: DNA-directed RNA polymerase subunit omega [Chitinophagales bacterium]
MDKIREYRNLEANEAIEPQVMDEIKEKSGNVYRSLAVIAKRSNQIGIELKKELNQKLEEFAATTDTLEEVLENREQIEISKYYEKLPHTTLLATKEFLEDRIYYKSKDEEAE